MEKFPLKICEVIQKKKLIRFPDYGILNGNQIMRLTDSRRSRSGKILKPYCGKYPYPIVTLNKNGIQHHIAMHRLIAHYFLGPCPTGKEVNHKDGNKRNFSRKNLEYLTRDENVHHAFAIGKASHKGVKNSKAKLNAQKVSEIKQIYKTSNISKYKLGKMFGVCHTTIRNIINNKTWKN